ncbi:MAG: ATP-binding protein [Gammaproteobacteria bacterium]
MIWKNRVLAPKLEAALERGKSILLLGPRQTGKTTLVKKLKHDKYITLMHPAVLQKYESNPSILIEETKAQQKSLARKPVIILDEVQKVPTITDCIQILIDDGIAQFIITGSSARKIKNLLPGRVIKYTLAPLNLLELDTETINLESILVNGSLPEVYNTKKQEDINELLHSYVSLYLEEEIRKEALVRNIGNFSNFLKLACIESGNLVHLRNIGDEIGVSHQTISDYYDILLDCMLVEKIEPLTKSITRKRLTKSPKFIMFDLGIKRFGANEPFNPGQKQLSLLFEQFIGLELSRMIRQNNLRTDLLFWRSHDGPEIDFILSHDNTYTPIEVKWTENPSQKDLRHIISFNQEYAVTGLSYIICRCDAPRLLADNVLALPWQNLPQVFKNIE